MDEASYSLPQSCADGPLARGVSRREESEVLGWRRLTDLAQVRCSGRFRPSVNRKECRVSPYIHRVQLVALGAGYETCRRNFRSTTRQMKASPQLERQCAARPTPGTGSKKSAGRQIEHFDALIARYYPAVYSFACRFTDDPRKACMLTRNAFNNTRKKLQTCCDKNVLASILISNVIRAGCSLNRTSRTPANVKRGTAISGGVMVLTGEP
jgi:hypothetical protein